MDFSASHGLKSYPSVCMSLSERMPGYRNKSQVPPIAPRRSKTAKVRSGQSRCKRTAAPMPDKPAPIMITSNDSASACCTDPMLAVEFIAIPVQQRPVRIAKGTPFSDEPDIACTPIRGGPQCGMAGEPTHFAECSDSPRRVVRGSPNDSAASQ